MTDARIHPETGKLLHRAVRPQIVRFGAFSQSVDVPGWYPEDDSDALFSGTDLLESDRVYAALKAAYAAHVRRVRKKLKLTQEEAGHLIGGGRRAFQKYESGVMAPSEAAIGLIEILARNPQEIAVLRALRQAA